MPPDILIINAVLYPEPGQNRTVGHGFVAVRNGRIENIGAMGDLADANANEIIDAGGCLVMPGLVNTHCHAAMTLFRGLADDLQLAQWLNEYIFPAEAAHVSTDMVYWCSKLAAAEMLLSGTTLAADGYFYEESAALACSEAGLRVVAAQGIIDFPAPGVPDPAGNIDAAARFVNDWLHRHPLVTPAVFAHSPYTCSPETLIRAKELAAEKNISLFIHVAESAGEHSLIKDCRGASPVQHLDALGVLDEQTVCVHCVWVDEEDIDILARRQAKVSICPQSHLKLASGHAPLPAMLAAGIGVGLGTDGAASNNGLDLFREMDVCAKIQKLRILDPTAAKAGDILRLATLSGARVLGVEGSGVLGKGSLADLIVVDLKQPHLQPFYGPDILVYGAGGGDVRDVIVAGKIVVRNGRMLTVDLEETMDRVRHMAGSLNV
ncbi:MAG: amidohydrolase [Desulfobulbaceae bacterium]|nr:amidohydrolase [Desulfobulbaceae bacterium]